MVCFLSQFQFPVFGLDMLNQTLREILLNIILHCSRKKNLLPSPAKQDCRSRRMTIGVIAAFRTCMMNKLECSVISRLIQLKRNNIEEGDFLFFLFCCGILFIENDAL